MNKIRLWDRLFKKTDSHESSSYQESNGVVIINKGGHIRINGKVKSIRLNGFVVAIVTDT